MTEKSNPFRSPPPPLAVTSYSVAQSVYNGGRFASGYGRALCTIALLVAVAISDFVGCWVCLSRNELLESIAWSDTPEQLDAVASDKDFTLVVWTNALISAGTAVAFLTWTHRAYRNLPALGNLNPKSNPALAVQWYFVPIANLLMPYKVMAEIARDSDPTSSIQSHETTPPLVSIWWGSFLLSNLAALIVCFNWSVKDPDLSTLMTANNTIIAAFVLEFLAAICAIRLVNWVDKSQTAKNVLIVAGRRPESTDGEADLDKFLERSAGVNRPSPEPRGAIE